MYKNPFQLVIIFNVCILMPTHSKNKYLAKYTQSMHVTRHVIFKRIFEISLLQIEDIED